MTGPRIDLTTPPRIDYQEQYGPGSQVASDQWQRSTDIQAQEVDRIMKFLASQGRDVKGYGAPGLAPIPAGIVQVGQDNKMTQQAKPLTVEEPDDVLIGQARFWGINEDAAKNMPRKELVDQLNFYRANARPDETDRGFFGATLGLAQFGAGGGKGLFSILSNTPLLPDVVKKVAHFHEAEQYFASLDEGVRSNIAEKDQKFATGLELAGGAVATWYPGLAAWKVAGLAGRAIPYGAAFISRAGYMAPIIRGAAAGAATGWMLEGDGKHARSAIIGGAFLGTGFGAAEGIAAYYAPQMMAALNRIAAAFKAPSADIKATATALREAETGVPEIPGYPRPSGFQGTAEQPPTGQFLKYPPAPEGFQPGGGAGGELVPSERYPVPPAGFRTQAPSVAGSSSGPLTADEFYQQAQGFRNRANQPATNPEERDNLLAMADALEAHANEKARGPDTGGWYSGAVRDLGDVRDPVRVAGEDAAAFTKRDIVAGSPDMPDLVTKTVIDDGTAVGAARASNPGGTSIVPNVDPDEVSMWMRPGYLETDAAELSGTYPVGKPGVSIEPSPNDPSITRVISRDAQGKPQGVLKLSASPEGTHDVMSVFVEPRARRQGVATSMYDAAEAAGLKVRSGQSGFTTEGQAFVDARAAARGEAPTSIPVWSTRFAKRPNSDKLDVLTGSDPITDGQVAQYEKHGLYDGQEVITPAGNRGRILSISANGTAEVQIHLNGDGRVPPTRMKASRLVGQGMSENVMEEPGLYEGFKQYVADRWSQASQAMAGAKMPGWLDTATTENLPNWFDDFMAQVGIDHPTDKAKILNYFNGRRVQDFRTLAPEAEAEASRVEGLVQTAQTEGPYFRTPQGPLQTAREMLQRRGYNLITEPGTSRLVIQSMTHPEANLPVADEAAALEFARTVNVDMPDYTPASSVPIETGRRIPTSEQTDPKLDNGDLGDRMGDAAVSMEADARGTEAGNFGPPEGFQGGSAFGGGEGPPPSLPRGGVPGEPAPENDALKASIERFKADSNYGRIMHEFANGVNRRLRAMNSRMKLLESDLSAAGFDVARPWKSYQALSNANDIKHNWEAPWMDRWAGIVEQFGRKNLRSGDVVRAYEIVDDAERLAFAKSRGFNSKEIGALDEMEKFFKDIFPETGIEANREIKRYISHVSARQQQGLVGDQGYGMDMLSPYTDFFAEHVREGGIQLRELDARQLGPLYIRALGFKKFLKAPFEEHVGIWNQVLQDKDLAPLANYMLDWTKLLRRGYVPGHDLVVDVVRTAFSPFVKLTNKEAAELVGAGLSVGHNSMLGFRPDVLLRDSIQPLLAVPRVGRKLFTVMKDYAAGTEAEKRAIWDRAVDNGWVQVERPRIEAPGIAERDEIIQNIPGQPMPPDQRSRRVVRAIGDMMWDVGAPVLRTLKNKNLTPLSLYTRLGERNRLFVGEAGYQHALENIGKFRAGKISRDDLMTEVVGTYDKPVQQRFGEILDSGNDQQAAILMGNELANVTQFRYGSLEAPEAMRTMTGRVGMQFGNFSLQFHAFASEALRNGNLAANAKFIGWMAAVAGSLELAKQATGWNFGKWQFYQAYTFAGSPWVQVAADMARGAGAASSQLQGRDLTPEQERDLQRAGDAFGTAVGSFNPVQSGLRTLEGIGQARQSEDPLDAIGRLIFVGERGTNRQTQNRLQVSADQAFANSFAPTPPGPTRAVGTVAPPQITGGSSGDIELGNGQRPIVSDTGRAAAKWVRQNMPSRDELNAAIAGDPVALSKFPPQDMDVLRGLAQVPVEDRYLLYESYHQLQVRGSPNTSQPSVPARTGPSHPAGGAFF